MTMNAHTSGFWAGMPTRLKAHLICWMIYWALALWLTAIGSPIGIALLIMPILWFLAKAWIFDGLLELDRNGGGLLNYTLGHIWNRSAIARTLLLVSGLGIALGGLGWFGTEDLRKAAAEPTLIERISDGAGNALEKTTETSGAAFDATAEATKGWLDRAKGWFGGDEEPPAE